jgi:hypothetical protein
VYKRQAKPSPLNWNKQAQPTTTFK